MWKVHFPVKQKKDMLFGGQNRYLKNGEKLFIYHLREKNILKNLNYLIINQTNPLKKVYKKF